MRKHNARKWSYENEKQETTSLGQEEQTTLNVRRTRIQRQWLEKLACFKKSKQQHWQRACNLASCKMHLRRLAWDLATFGINSSIDYQASASLYFHQRILWKIAINNVAWHNVSYFSFRDYHIETLLAFTTLALCFEMLFNASGACKTKHHEDVLGTRVPNFITPPECAGDGKRKDDFTSNIGRKMRRNNSEVCPQEGGVSS